MPTSTGAEIIRTPTLVPAIKVSLMTASSENSNRWAVIPAGGDGTRLLPLTRHITGDARPKQFCAFSGDGTLLDQTRRRVSQVVPERNSIILLTQTHEHWYRSYLAGTSPNNLLIQPSNCGTAFAIAYGLTHLNNVAPQAIVSFFPSDHHISNTQLFTHYVGQTFADAETWDKVVLLGVPAASPEESYGWIEPGTRLRSGLGGDLFEVRQFREKPSTNIALRLMAAGCLWNSFVMVGRVEIFLKTMRRALPELVDAFASTPAGVTEIYKKIAPRNFSHDVLAESPANLAVLAAEQLGWTDLGEPERVRAFLNDYQLA